MLRGLVLAALLAVAWGFDAPRSKTKKNDAPATEAARATYALEHSFDGGASWSPRGRVAVQFARSARVGGAADVLDLAVWSASQTALFKVLLIDHDLYMVRARSSMPGFGERTVLASLPACLLAASNFAEHWVVQTDAYGNLLGVNYGIESSAAATAAAVCAKTADGSLPAIPAAIQVRASASVAASTFGTCVLVFSRASSPPASASPSPFPFPRLRFLLLLLRGHFYPLCSHVVVWFPGERPVGEVIDTTKPAAAPEPGFLSKYWYIILPVVLVICMGGGERK